MKLENNFISPSQLFYLVCCFLVGTSIVISPGGMAGNTAWLAVVAGLAEGLILLALYISLASRYSGKTLIAINDMVFGPYVGKLFSLAYLLFFFHIGAEILRTFGEFFRLIMVATPLPVLIIGMLLITALALKNGIEVIARCSQILLLIILVVFTIDFILLLKDFNITNFLPFMDVPINKFILASHSVAVLPFGEAIVFLMIIAFVNQPGRAGQVMGKAFLLAAILLSLSAVRAIAVLGPVATISTFPAYATVRIISIANILTRLEIIPASVFLFMGFIKFTVFYYVTVMGISEMLKMRSYQPLVLPVGALLGIISLLLYDQYIYDLIDASILFPFYSIFFVFLLPLITLIVSIIRKNKYTQEVNSAG